MATATANTSAPSDDWIDASDSDFGVTVRFTKEPESKWEEENTEFVGNPIQGLYIMKKENVGAHGSTVYVISLNDGSSVSVFGSTVLDAYFNEGNSGKPIPLQSEVRINFTGIVKGEKSTYKGFKVEWRPTPFVEAAV